MFPIVIDTEFCVALLETRHAEVLAEVVESNRGRLGHRLPWTWEANLEDIRRFIACGENRFARRNGFEVGVWAGNELAGGIGLYPRSSSVGTFELEYWLSCWSRWSKIGAMHRISNSQSIVKRQRYISSLLVCST